MPGGDHRARAIAAAAAVAAAAAAALLALGSAHRARRRRQPGPQARSVRRQSWRAWERADGAPEPAVLSGAPLGPCIARWTTGYLEATIGERKVSVHVSGCSGLDFVSKNFAYEVMPFREVLRRAHGGADGAGRYYYYYRSQHEKRNKPASLESLAPLDKDFELPRALEGRVAVHSTVLRVASAGLRMWLHYDVCDNFLCCVSGRKRVVLLPPSEAGRCYLQGSSSALGSRLLEGTAARRELWRAFPLAEAAWGRRQDVVLEEGELLFIPALWLHCTEALGGAGADEGVCVSLNVFIVWPDQAELHDPKDVWANRDLLPAQEAFKALEGKVWPALRRVPSQHRAFHCRRLAAELVAMAEEADG